MSAAEISVNWYADDKRAAVTDETGTKWWLAPNGQGGYSAICDGTGDVITGQTAAQALENLLGEQARLFMAGSR